MKAVIVSDLHFHEFAAFAHTTEYGINSRLAASLEVLDQIYSRAIDLGANAVIVPGDVFHTPKRITASLLSQVSKFFHEHDSILWLILRGNHDTVDETNRVYTTSFLRGYRNVHLFEEPKSWVYGTHDLTTSITFIPYTKDLSQLKEALDLYRPQVNSPRKNILVIHTGISGVPLSSGIVLDVGVVDPNLFIGWDMTFAGHYHSHASGKYPGGEWIIPGSHLQHDFSEEGDEKGFIFADFDKLTWEFEAIQSPKFVTISVPRDAILLEGLKDEKDYYFRIESTDTRWSRSALDEFMKGSPNPYTFKRSVESNKTNRLDLNLMGSIDTLIDKYVDHMKPEGLDLETLKRLGKYEHSLCGNSSTRGVGRLELVSIEIWNFQSIEHAYIVLSPGVYDISGENYDTPGTIRSNGSGKSSIVEALYYGFTGKTIHKGSSADLLVRKGSDGLRVKIVARDSIGRQIVTDRHRGHKTDGDNHYVTLDGQSLSAHKKADTQEALERLTGLTPEILSSVDILAKRELLLSQGESYQKTVIEALLGFETLVDAFKNVNARLKSEEEEIVELEVEINLLNRNVLDSGKRIGDLVTSKDKVEAEDAKRVENLDNQIRSYRTQVLEAESKIEKYEAETEEVEALLDSENVRLVHFREALDKYREAKETSRISGVKIQNKVNLAKSNIAALIKSIKNIESHVPGTTCSACGQIVDEGGSTMYLLALQTSLTSHTIDLEEAEAQLELLHSDYRYSKEMYDAINLDLDYVSKNIRCIQDRQELIIRYRSQETVKIKGLEDTIRVLEESKAKASNKESIESLLLKEEVALDALLKEIDEKKVKVVDLKDKLRYLQFWSHGFSPSGLRSYIFDVVSKDLNDAVSTSLNSLGGHLNLSFSSQKRLKGTGELKDKLSVTIGSSGGIEAFSQASAGERMLLEIATVLAARDLRGMNRTTPNFLFIDEALDTVDSAGFGEIITLLKDKATEQGLSIFVIGHNDSHRDYFDKHIKVIKFEGKSKVEML